MASRKRKAVPSVEEIRKEKLRPAYFAEEPSEPEVPPEEEPEDNLGTGDGEPVEDDGDGWPVILRDYGPSHRVPQDEHEKHVLGAWYNAVRHYLRGDISYDKQHNWINYGARIQALAGETIAGDEIETRLDMIEHYAMVDAIADGPYDN